MSMDAKTFMTGYNDLLCRKEITLSINPKDKSDRLIVLAAALRNMTEEDLRAIVGALHGTVESAENTQIEITAEFDFLNADLLELAGQIMSVSETTLGMSWD